MKQFSRYILFVTFMAFTMFCIAQNESKKWYFGAFAGLDFMTVPPSIISNTNMNTGVAPSCMSDAAGNILFYTNANTIWNQAHAVMANGTGLAGAFSLQCVISFKQPGSANSYYVFVQRGTTGLYYSSIDMTLAAGMGSVTSLNNSLGGVHHWAISAVKHCNGTDIWVIAHDYAAATFRAFLVTSAGVNPVPVVSNVGTLFGALSSFVKVSPNGRKLALQVGSNAQAAYYDFDPGTGIVSNETYLGMYMQGFEFSPDGTKLYSMQRYPMSFNTDVIQWDLCAGSLPAVVASSVSVGTSTSIGGMLQLAPNAKIYIARSGKQALGIINNPNVLGIGSNFVDVGQSISPNLSTDALPHFLAGAALNKIPPPPFTSTVSNAFGCQTASFTAVPNPTTSCAVVSYSLQSVQWNFGDPASGAANTSTLMSPGHFFTSPGLYNVQLILYNSCGGGTDTLNQQVNINQPCFTVTSNSISCSSLGTATVISTSSGGPFSYTWMPSNQTTSVATNLSPGTYTILVFDQANNNTFSATTQFTSLTPITGTLNNTTSLTCSSYSNGSAAYSNISGGSGNQTYLWTNGSLSYTSPNPGNLSAGSWTSVVTDALTGCTINNTFTITQPPALTLAITASSPSICAGGNIVLTGNASGGTGGHTYTWTGGPQNQSCTVSQNTGGTPTYTLNSSDANNCLTTTVTTVSFVQNPTLTVANVSVCPLQTATLTANGAVSYTWSNSGTGNTLTDNPAIHTGYTVTGSANGCSATATASVIIKSLPIPSAGNTGSLCSGNNFTLNAGGGSSYSWNGPFAFSSITQNPVVTSAGLNNAGVYNLTVTAANNCTASASTTVVIQQTPTVSVVNGVACTGQTLNLSSNSVAGATYFWTGPQSFTSALQNVSIVAASLNQSGNYVVQVTAPNTCTNLAVAVANVSAAPVLTIALSSTSMCAQALSGSPNSIVLNSSGANSYTLNVPNHIYNPNPSGPASPLSLVPPYISTGISTATLFGSNGVCTVSTTAIFSVIPNPTVSIVSPTPVICAGQTVTYTSAGANSYNWSAATPGSFVYTTGNVAVANPSISSVFSVFGGSLGCNSALQSHNITVNPLPVLNVSNAMVCSGSSALLTTTGTGTSFTWSPGLYLNNTNSASVLVTPLSPQNYTVIASLTNCTTSAVLTVSTLPLPVVSISADKTTFCQNDKIIMEGMGGSTYSWEGPSGYKGFGKVLEVSAFSTAYSGIYTLTIQDENNCNGIVTQAITVHSLPQGSFAGYLQQGCAPLCTDFNFKPSPTSPSIVSSSWQVGNQQMGNTNFSYCFNSPGTYVISGSLTDVHNCSNTVSTTVNVHPKPVADFYFTPNEPLENWEEVQLIDASQNAVRHSWKIGNVNFSSTSLNPSYLFENAGTYPVALVVNNQWQCSDTIVKTIHVAPDFAVYVPNAFTPNADDLNETLIPVIRGNYQFTFSVFNRWGQKVFETSDITKGWDGTFKGQPCQQDTYAWKLNVSFETKMMTTNGKQEKNLAGSVLLYR